MKTMLKKIYLTLFIVLMASNSKEQAPASIVYDPTNGAHLASVLETIKGLKQSTEEWKANAEFLNKIATEGAEVKRLVAMLEGMICATDELELYAGLSGNLALCENKLEFDITLMKIEGVSEKLNWITTGSILLTQYETIQSLKDLNDQLEDAIRQVNNLNRFMRGNLLRTLIGEWERENAASGFSSLTEMNI